VGVLACAPSALANPFGPGFRGGSPGAFRGGPPAARLEQRLEALGLAPEQMERVRAILDSTRDEREAVRARMREARREMHQMLAQDTPDEAAVMQHVDKMGALDIEARKIMLRTLLAVRAELTPAQRAELKEMQPGPRFNRWPEGPPPGF
ncbi:MAG: Spy/CpxP family protein refolding chaperone, partial [Gammaproteobacteria bacterium]|nr:Spy/CpxP family protein refolding chaperone [Gammaproteobacteria bacterium]